MIYKEWLYDRLKGNVLIVFTQADCIVVDDQNSLAQRPSGQSVTPPQPQPNPEAEAARDKVIKDAFSEYDDCVLSEMKRIVPYSSESSEVLSQVIVTNCHSKEQQVIDLIIAIYGGSRSEVERIIKEGVEIRKNKMLADIVTFRAELARSLSSQPKPDSVPKADNASKNDLGLWLNIQIELMPWPSLSVGAG